MVFAVGGGMSVYEGILHLLHPRVMENARWNYLVLGAAALIEGASWIVAARQFAQRLDGQGIWTSPDGSRVAWFKDADGNTLSLTERGEGQWPGSA